MSSARSTAKPCRPGLRRIAVVAGAALALGTGLFVTPGGAVALTPRTAPNAASAVLPSATDPADRKAAVDRQIGDLRSQLEDTSEELVEAYVALKRTQGQLATARDTLTRANTRLAATQAHLLDVQQRLDVARANEARAAEQLAANAAETADAQRRVGNMAADAYRAGGLTGLTVALDAASPRDFADRMILIDTVMRVQSATLRDLSARKSEAIAQQSYLVAVRRQIVELEAEAENAVADAAQAKADAVKAKAAIDVLVQQQSRYAASVAAKKAGEDAKLRQMQGESERLEQVLAARAKAARAKAAREAAAREAARKAGRKTSPPPSSPAPGGGTLAYPVNARVSSEFGLRYHPILHTWRLHAGMDFAAACGTPVVAAGSGQVVSAGWSGGYGNRIVIDHGVLRGVSLATTYNHLTTIVRGSGSVSRGQLIGYSGTTGLSTGCHLHFETRVNGTPVNPRAWL